MNVEHFAALFPGSARGRGKYTVGKTVDAKGKRKGKAITETDGGATLEHFTAHLLGKVGLGVIPIDDDGTCMFGVIDVDNYSDLDHAALAARIKAMGLPLVVCRSKSGGAHLYLYLSEAATAAQVRELLAKWTKVLGYSEKTEIFPKQDGLDGPDDFGNWINLPFFDSERTTRYAVNAVSGKAMLLDEFITVAEGMRTTIEAAEEIVLPEPPQTEQPESTASQRVRDGDVPEGQRHNDLKTWLVAKRKQGLDIEELGILVRNKAPELWAEAEQREGLKEAEQILRWIEKKIMPEPEDFEQLVRLELGETVIWKLRVRGQWVRLDTAQLDTYRSMRRAVMEQIAEVLPELTRTRWNSILTALMAGKTTEVGVDDFSPAGLAWNQTLNFLTIHGTARARDEILLGRAWCDEEKSRVYFISDHLIKNLRMHRNFIELKEIYLLLKSHGGFATTLSIAGKTTRVWWLPEEAVAMARQTEEFAPVRVPGVEEF